MRCAINRRGRSSGAGVSTSLRRPAVVRARRTVAAESTPQDWVCCAECEGRRRPRTETVRSDNAIVVAIPQKKKKQNQSSVALSVLAS